MPAPRLTIISGEPGEVWTNSGTKVLYQLQVQFVRSCAVCIEKAGQIAAYWPVPFHRGCNCINVPVPPGQQAPRPFVDYQAEVAALDPAQQRAVMGRNAWRLVESGTVKWEDVVTRSRIRPLHEVVDRLGLTYNDLRDAGVPSRIASDAYDAVHRPEQLAARLAQAGRIAELEKLGLKKEHALDVLAGKLATRFRLEPGPPGSGPLVVPYSGPAVGPLLPKPKPKPKAKPKPKPPPPPKVPTGPFPEDVSGLKVVRKLGGSTGAELVEDEFGRRFVRKRGGSPEHLREEAEADRLYAEFGASVPRNRVFETASGPVKLAEFVEGESLAALRARDPAAARKAEAELRKHFAVDALLGNWDVVGLDEDNVLVGKDGKVYRIDNGGALRFRAQGARKGAAFGTEVKELDTLRDARINPVAARVFGPLSDDAVKTQVQDVLARAGAAVRGSSPEVRAVLESRLEYLREYVRPPVPRTGPREFTKLGVKPTRADLTAAERYAEAHWQEWKRSLSSDQKSALESYKGFGYTSINGSLRGKKKATPELVAEIKAIDTAVNLAHLPEAVVTWRGVKDRSAMNLQDPKVGDRFSDPGYVSVSLNKEISSDIFYDKNSGAMFRIRLPEGTPAVHLDVLAGANSPGVTGGEYELMLARGSEFRVTAVGRYEDGGLLIDVEYVGSPHAVPKPK